MGAASQSMDEPFTLSTRSSHKLERQSAKTFASLLPSWEPRLDSHIQLSKLSNYAVSLLKSLCLCMFRRLRALERKLSDKNPIHS